MSFDFGLNRIGVATGNIQLKIPHPLTTITGQNKFEKLDKIAALVDKWKPQLFIVGKPLTGGGKDDFMANINRFANRLMHRFKLPVLFVDESYSSAYAADQLNEQAVFGRMQDNRIDQLAACAILETYFNNYIDINRQSIGKESE